MVKASEKLVRLLVDAGKDGAIFGKYGVRGMPTIKFFDSDAKEVAQLGARDAASVEKQILDVATKYKRGPGFGEDVAKAVDQAKTDSKPLGIYFYDVKPSSAAVDAAFTDALLKDVLDKFVFAKVEVKKDSADCKKYKVSSAPTILVLDASQAAPEDKPVKKITGKKTAKELKSELESALKSFGTK